MADKMNEVYVWANGKYCLVQELAHRVMYYGEDYKTITVDFNTIDCVDSHLAELKASGLLEW